jgi:uncharacterized protein (TIGR02453 family)
MASVNQAFNQHHLKKEGSMTPIETFTGFPDEGLTFFRELALHNYKSWFDAHRDDFDRYVMIPARALVIALGERFNKLTPGINADPRINQSIFRINRDTRFSRDKTPYKTHLAMVFWQGAGPRMERPSFYLHIDPEKVLLGGGIYMFPSYTLTPYRQALVDPMYGPALAKAVQAVTGAGFVIGGRHYKKTPRGFDPDHENAALLLHNGLYAGREMAHPVELHSEDFPDFVISRYEHMLPLHDWLVAFTGRLPHRD